MRNAVKKSERIYLDHAATTPVDPRVLSAMRPYEEEIFGNPSSLHLFGQEASRGVFGAKRVIAGLIGASEKEIVFTASATEANNLIIEGVAEGARTGRGGEKIQNPRIIILSTEHESVLEPVEHLKAFGVDVVKLPVSREGIVNLEALRKALTKETVLVSVQYANSETGAIQPISEIGNLVKEFKKEIDSSEKRIYPMFHTDAVQALPFLELSVAECGVDAMTLSSHKIYGPKGVGALYIKEKAQKAVAPRTRGGEQEMKLRAGTEHVSGIVGFGEAVTIVKRERVKDAARIGKLRNKLIKEIKSFWKGAELNGPKENERLPGNVNLYLPGISAGELLIRLDMKGVSASAGSACASRAPEPSHVLLAMGFSKERALSSVRFTLGRKTSEEKIAKTVKILKEIYSDIQ